MQKILSLATATIIIAVISINIKNTNQMKDEVDLNLSNMVKSAHAFDEEQPEYRETNSLGLTDITCLNHYQSPCNPIIFN